MTRFDDFLFTSASKLGQSTLDLKGTRSSLLG